MPEFVPGRELSRAFYFEVVQPALRDVRHSAGLLGFGSDVLGFDDERSTDHGWGPRLQVFVETDDVERGADAVERALPETFRGWPTRYGWDAVPVSHHVEVVTVEGWFRERLGLDPRAALEPRDWLVLPQQLLLEATAGPLFHDGLGELEPIREALAWYPDDVWLWLLACQWRRIDQEEPFVGRTAEVGDEVGSRILAARLVRDVVRLCFLLERRYAPYSKWLGSAFRRRDAYAALGEPALRALAATGFPEREEALLAVIVAAAEQHNALRITSHVDPSPSRFHSRPFRVLGSGRFVDACLERVRDPWLRPLPLIGAVDQVADSTDLLSYPQVARRVSALYEEAPAGTAQP